jgi:hypothetical protein
MTLEIKKAAPKQKYLQFYFSTKKETFDRIHIHSFELFLRLTSIPLICSIKQEKRSKLKRSNMRTKDETSKSFFRETAYEVQ